jgi:serine/threonine protein kinase
MQETRPTARGAHLEKERDRGAWQREEAAPNICKCQPRSLDMKAVLEPGTIIGGVYRVIGPLGSGSMGAVLLAEDTLLDRRVAIKLVHPWLLDKRFRERFMAEARAMARVSHANVLQIYAFGEHDGAPYFVMEFVAGCTLEQWLVNNTG